MKFVKVAIARPLRKTFTYKKVNTMNSKLEEITKKERGIDHDFLFSLPKENSYKKDRLIVRFKNHKVAVDFAEVIDLFSSTCKN